MVHVFNIPLLCPYMLGVHQLLQSLRSLYKTITLVHVINGHLYTQCTNTLYFYVLMVKQY